VTGHGAPHSVAPERVIGDRRPNRLGVNCSCCWTICGC